jgi:hypothetical protein
MSWSSPRMRNRFQVALTLSTGHGTPFTALMSPQRSSSCTPVRSQACHQQSMHGIYHYRARPEHQLTGRWRPRCRTQVMPAEARHSRTLAVVAQAADTGLVASRRGQHVVRKDQVVLRDSSPICGGLDLPYT